MGSAAEQRNWALLAASGRVAVVDDDVVPGILDSPLEQISAAAYRCSTRLLDLRGRKEFEPSAEVGKELLSGDVEVWESDVLGLLELSGTGLVSARFTGDLDMRAFLQINRMLSFNRSTIRNLGSAGLHRPLRRDLEIFDTAKFRGACFATSTTQLESPPIVTWRGRNEDFVLGICGTPENASETQFCHIVHTRGKRHTGLFEAHVQEQLGYFLCELLTDQTVPELSSLTPERLCRLPPGLPKNDVCVRTDLSDVVGKLERYAEKLEARCCKHLRELKVAQTIIVSAGTLETNERLETLVEKWVAGADDAIAKRLAYARHSLEHSVASLDDDTMRDIAEVLLPLRLVSGDEPGQCRAELSALSRDELTIAARRLAVEVTWLSNIKGGHDEVKSHSAGSTALGVVQEDLAQKVLITQALLDDVRASGFLRSTGDSDIGGKAMSAGELENFISYERDLQKSAMAIDSGRLAIQVRAALQNVSGMRWGQEV